MMMSAYFIPKWRGIALIPVVILLGLITLLLFALLQQAITQDRSVELSERALRARISTCAKTNPMHTRPRPFNFSRKGQGKKE